MTDTTPRTSLPLLAAAQAQKHVTHNEALIQLDALLYARILDRDLTAPPSSPADGDTYLVKATATGAWTGQSNTIAAALDGAWRFYAPFTGLSLYVADEQKLIVFDGTMWQDYAAILALQNVPLLGVNTTADTTNKLAVKSSALLFDNTGAGIQTKLNKHATGDTASLLYQTNYSGRAEFGLTGDDDLHLKVSPDGTTWTEALHIAAATGRIGMGASPATALDINLSGQTPPSPVSASNLRVTTTGGGVCLDAVGGNGSMLARRWNGTFASPTALLSGDIVFRFAARGYTGAAMASGNAATFGVSATENWSATANGACWTFDTMKTGTTTAITAALTIWDDARLQPKGAYADLSYAWQQPTTGFTITIADACGRLILAPTGTLATGSITMPAAPKDGQLCRIATSQAITALTLSPNSGQSITGAPATLAANAVAEFTYRAANTTWYRTG